MSLPRPGGYPGDKKTSHGGGLGYTGNYGSGAGGVGGGSGGSVTTPTQQSAFAGYTPPASIPTNPYNNAGQPSGNARTGPGGYSSGAGRGYTGSGYSGGGGTSAAGGGGFAAPAPGGALGSGVNQYGFSTSTGGIGGGGMAPLGSNMGASAGAGAGGGEGGRAGVGGPAGQPLDWHQWAPEGVNVQMVKAVGGTVARNFNVAQYQPRMSGVWNTFKAYFAVDNGYVLKKIKVLLLPIFKKDWYRLPSEDEVKDDGRPKYERPLQDVNAPDLYVPLMSFITFVLVTGYAKGAAAASSEGRRSFSPEVLTEVMSSCVVAQLLEVLVMRLGLYLLNSPAVVLDLVAYTGYQYVGLCINMSFGVWLGKTAYFLALLWTGLMTSFFMFKTMAHTVPTGSSSREVMILGFGALQLLSMWWLGYSNDLNP